jgi:hypothetical protein
MKTNDFSKKTLILLFIGVVGAGGCLGFYGLGWMSAKTWGAVLGLCFASLYFSELKQETFAQLYQAVANAVLRTREMLEFDTKVMEQVKEIRRLLMFSNLIKLIGAALALYLMNEDKADQGARLLALRLSLICLGIGLVIFVVMWKKATQAEDLAVQIKEKTVEETRRAKYLTDSQTAMPHDFAGDPALAGYAAEKPFEEAPVIEDHRDRPRTI